jgi:hypothetical protein
VSEPTGAANPAANAARRSLAWLESVAGRLPAASASLRIQSLLLSVLCTHLGAAGDALSRRLAAVVGEIETDDLQICDARLLLLASGACRQVTGQIPSGLLRWLSLAAAVLPDGPSDNPGEHYASWALWRLGQVRGPPHLSVQWPDARTMLFADATALRRIERLLCVKTEQGTRDVSAPDDVRAAVRACAAYYLSAYDFEVGGKFLRAAAHLGDRDHRLVRWGREFLLTHQTNAGPFGFVAREDEYIRAIQPEYESLQLPFRFTLAALWTLAETESRAWSLEAALLPGVRARGAPAVSQ